jgi:hypothetical protein
MKYRVVLFCLMIVFGMICLQYVSYATAQSNLDTGNIPSSLHAERDKYPQSQMLDPNKDTAPTMLALVCPFGQSACKGRYGERCYDQARGESCTDGLVCSFGQSACKGRYGERCYDQARGESCTDGLVCSFGQSACISNGQASCYDKARGESCN